MAIMKYSFPVILVLVFALSALAQTPVTALPTDFTAWAMDGSAVDTRALRGKIVVLNLWFINCPNCIEEIRMLNTLVDEYKASKDVVFLAPAASSKPDLDKFLAKHPFSYQVIPNASSIILFRFGTPDKSGEIDMPFPMHIVLDRDGKVIAKVQGVKGVDAVRAELSKQFSANEPVRPRTAP
jgi:peroxiredoxin